VFARYNKNVVGKNKSRLIKRVSILLLDKNPINRTDEYNTAKIKVNHNIE
jgi:hypothetical protein